MKDWLDRDGLGYVEVQRRLLAEFKVKASLRAVINWHRAQIRKVALAKPAPQIVTFAVVVERVGSNFAARVIPATVGLPFKVEVAAR